MFINQIFKSLKDSCRVCGQTPCNCTHIAEEKVRLDPKCWKGYKKQGTKMKGGVRVNNCVPAESVEEAAETKTMSRAAKGHEKYGKEGMQALAKAGREGASEKKLDTIRDKYDRYDEAANPAQQAAIAIAKKKKAGVAEGIDRLDSFTRKVLNRMQDDSWLSAERAYFIQKGAEQKMHTNREQYNQEIQRFIDLYRQYKGQQGVAEGKQPGKPVVDAILKVIPVAQEIWFHGSRATGSHRKNSDTDILVIVPDDLVGDQYLGAVRILQKLSTHFDNHDIQPTKSGTNIHRIAQEEGQLLWSNKQGVAEGTGNAGNAIKTLFQKIYDQGDDEIEYFYYESPVFAHYWDKYEGDIDSIIAEVNPKELQIIHDELEAYAEGAGLAEANKLPGTPVVSLSDFGDKDNTKDRYGRTVPKKLKKDDPRVRFHKDYSQHEKKLISKMSNAEKADKGWRNPNIDEQGVAEGAEFGAYYYEQLAQQVFDINPDLTDENEILNLGYKIAKGELGSRAQGIFRGEDFPSDFVSAYGYLKKPGVAEVSDATLTSYLTKVDADSQKHEKDPTKRSAEKRNRSVAGFARAFNKLDARKEKTDEVKQKAVPSSQRDPGALATRSHIASQEKAHSDWDQRQKKLSDEFYKNHPELDDRPKSVATENSMADELARMAMKRNPKALVRVDGKTLQSPPPGPKPAGTTAPRPAPKFDPEAEYSDDYSAWHRRTHSVKEDSAVDRLVKEFDEMLSARMNK